MGERGSKVSKKTILGRLRIASIIFIFVGLLSALALCVFSIIGATQTKTVTSKGTTLIVGNMSHYAKPCLDIPGIRSHRPVAYYLNHDTSDVLSCPWSLADSALRITASFLGVVFAVLVFFLVHIKVMHCSCISSIAFVGAAAFIAYCFTNDVRDYVSSFSWCHKGMESTPFNPKNPAIDCKMERFLPPVIIGVFTCVFILAAAVLTLIFECKGGKSYFGPEKKKFQSSDEYPTDDGIEIPADKKGGFSLFGRKNKKKVADGDLDFESQGNDDEKAAMLKKDNHRDEDGVDFESEGKKRYSPWKARKEEKRAEARNIFGSSSSKEPETASETAAPEPAAGNDLFDFDGASKKQEEAKKQPKPQPAPQPEPKVVPQPQPVTSINGDEIDFESIPESKK